MVREEDRGGKRGLTVRFFQLQEEWGGEHKAAVQQSKNPAESRDRTEPG